MRLAKDQPAEAKTAGAQADAQLRKAQKVLEAAAAGLLRPGLSVVVRIDTRDPGDPAAAATR